MDDLSDRFALPLLRAGQAQKELFHNEALLLLDLLLHPRCESLGDDAPPADPRPGQCWVVGAAPVAAWAGHAGALAGWTAGGWRFASPVAGLAVRVGAAGTVRRFDGVAWAEPPAAMAAPAGGAVVDAEARAALLAIAGALRHHGLIAT